MTDDAGPLNRERTTRTRQKVPAFFFIAHLAFGIEKRSRVSSRRFTESVAQLIGIGAFAIELIKNEPSQLTRFSLFFRYSIFFLGT